MIIMESLRVYQLAEYIIIGLVELGNHFFYPVRLKDTGRTRVLVV